MAARNPAKAKADVTPDVTPDVTDTPDVTPDVTDTPDVTPDVTPEENPMPDDVNVFTVIAGILAWLRTPEGDKGWQALCSAKPTPAIAASWFVRDGLTSKSRPCEGFVPALPEHSEEIVATYPSGRRVVSRTDDGIQILRAGEGHPFAVMLLQMASWTRIAESADPWTMAEEIHGAADKRASEEAAKAAARMIKRAESALKDAWSMGNPQMIAAAVAFAESLGIDPKSVQA